MGIMEDIFSHMVDAYLQENIPLIYENIYGNRTCICVLKVDVSTTSRFTSHICNALSKFGNGGYKLP